MKKTDGQSEKKGGRIQLYVVLRSLMISVLELQQGKTRLVSFQLFSVYIVPFYLSGNI